MTLSPSLGSQSSRKVNNKAAFKTAQLHPDRLLIVPNKP